MVTRGGVGIEKEILGPQAGVFLRRTIAFGGLYPKDPAFESGAATVSGDIDRFAAPFPVVGIGRVFRGQQIKIDRDRVGGE